MHRSAQLLAAAATLRAPTSAVLYGDEIYQDVEGGKFWAFYNEGVAIIDPESCSIEATITEDSNGDLLPNSFNDAVYMQSKDNKEGYVLVGSRVDETNEFGENVSHMHAFSTTQRKAISKAEVGPRVVHSYGVWPQGEFWMHSDGNGLFYVFDVDDLTKTTHDNIEAKVEEASHGKLLWDESPKLGNRGFGTSTGETFLFEFDLSTKEQVTAYDFSVHEEIVDCRGLHAIAYSDLNMHVYAECSGGGGALEFDISNGSIQFVQQFSDANGALYETPDGRFVVASSKGMEALFVFVPNGSGKKSSVEYIIKMEGRPSSVSFYTNKDDDVIACSPLTENLNQNQRRSDGTIACGYYEGCTGAASTADVEAGICLHDDTELKLMRVADTAIAEVSNLDGLCDRCQDTTNFEIDAETGASSCTCTPHCGSCDPNPAYSDKDSGYMCVNLSAYVDAETSGGKAVSATLVPGTGGVLQGSRSSTECTFGRTYRTHKRGTKYDAAVANIPSHSIVIIDMEKMEKKCAVNLPAAPNKVLYAPNEPVTLSDSAGATKTVSFALVVLMGMVAAMI
jgi:hypothetical protein